MVPTDPALWWPILRDVVIWAFVTALVLSLWYRAVK